MNNNKQERIFEYDFIRFIAISAVIMLHCAAIFVIKFLPHDTRFLIGNIFDSISRFAVPFFVMLSGIFMLDENKILPYKKLAKKIGKLFILLVIWNILYAFIYHKNAFLYYLFFGEYHLWYLYMIIGLYLISPILRLFVKEENKTVLYYFVILAIIFQFCPTFIDFCCHRTNYVSKFFNMFNLNFVLEYTTYYILGRLIVIDFERIIKYKKYMITLGIIALTTIIAGSEIYTTKTVKAYDVFMSNKVIPVLVYSISTFIFLKESIKRNEHKISTNIKQFITSVSKLSFGMYLIHVFILRTLRTDILNNIFSITMKDSNTAFYIIITFLITFILSYIIIFILSKIKYVNQLIKI